MTLIGTHIMEQQTISHLISTILWSNHNSLHQNRCSWEMVRVSLYTILDILPFPSLVIPSKFFTLKQLLHVLEIIKNLLSVSKFANDDHVFFEFHLNSYFVKDLATKTILLQGQLKGGLYVFDNTQLNISHQWKPSSSSQSSKISFLSCFTTTSISPKTSTAAATLENAHSSFSLWHDRLGHLSAKICLLYSTNVIFHISIKSHPLFALLATWEKFTDRKSVV